MRAAGSRAKSAARRLVKGAGRTGAAVKSAVRKKVGKGRRGEAAKAAVPAPAAAATKPPASAEPRPARLTEEEQIEAAKYTPRELPPRLFEEERFLFPRTYGVDRVRLLVKDPEWLFAYWDVSPRTLQGLRRDVGARAAAMSPLTLRVVDPEHGGEKVILLPEGAKSWYVRADDKRRPYQAELGLTLPSGEFRRIATSNVVEPPRPGVSPRKATRRASFREPWRTGRSVMSAAVARAAAVGPWRPAPGEDGSLPPPPSARAKGKKEKGGASDRFRR